MNQNFDPIYSALATLLLRSATVPFTASATAGSGILTGIPSTASLTPGLAVIGDGSIPVGDRINTVDSDSQITLLSPAIVDGPLSLVAGFANTDPLKARLLKHWTSVDASSMPALFLAQGDEFTTKRTGQVPAWTLDPTVWVYCTAPDDSTPSAPTLNALLGAVRAAFGADVSGPGRIQNRQTLGGLVFDTWINGKIETDDGALGQLAVAKIPVRVNVNGPN